MSILACISLVIEDSLVIVDTIMRGDCITITNDLQDMVTTNHADIAELHISQNT